MSHADGTSIRRYGRGKSSSTSAQPGKMSDISSAIAFRRLIGISWLEDEAQGLRLVNDPIDQSR
jgi:hypothetical protein